MVEWGAGTAHSSWIELLLSIGILGPLLVITDILYLLTHASSRQSVTPPSLILSLLAFLVVASITSETLAFPGIGFVMLALLHGPVLARRSSLSPGGGVRSGGPRGDDADSESRVLPAFVGRL
jgi:hypothetical protein